MGKSRQRKLTVTQAKILDFAVNGRSLYTGCKGMSECGGRARAVRSLVRAGLLDLDNKITEAGRDRLQAATRTRGQSDRPAML